MGVSIIGTVGVPANYGGFESLVENLLPFDKDVLIYCSSKAYDKKQVKYKGAKLCYIPLNANGVQSVLYDTLSLLHSFLFTRNDLLILGVSGAIFLPVIRLFSKRKIITNIDGLEWKRDKWGTLARKFLKFSEKVAVNYSHVVIADNKGIADHVADEYSVKAEVIAYGGDHALLNKKLPKVKSNALALCRIEPENNVEMILEAFAQLPEKEITFIGNWERSEFGRKLKRQYQKYSNISITDPIYDLDELFDIRAKCDVYIHGHSAGGTNPSLVEMMFFEKTIFCFDCIYNRSTTEDKALFFSSASDIIHMLRKTEYDPSQVGLALFGIADRKYRWKYIKARYLALFS